MQPSLGAAKAFGTVCKRCESLWKAAHPQGGARPGAGRPRLPDAARLEDFKVRLDQPRLEKLNLLRRDGETARDVIRRLIDEA